MASDQELIILGLLKKGPMHGYQIRNKLRQILEIFVGVDTESIYYPLKIMEKNGFVSKKIGRVGKRPEKYVYSLSSEGENRFLDLLNKSFVTVSRPRFNIDLSLYFLPYMSPKEIKHKLNVRLRMLRKIQAGLEHLRRSKKVRLEHHMAIINHDLELIKAEILFVSGLIGNQKFFSSAQKNNI